VPELYHAFWDSPTPRHGTCLAIKILELILERNSAPQIGVWAIGFWPGIWTLNAALTEPSLEKTGRDAYQVIRVRFILERPEPGSTIGRTGVKKVRAISVIGNDGEGMELLQALDQLHS